jgi:hypothetical protein
MTLSEYLEAVKLILVNKYKLTEAQALDVVNRHSGTVSYAWEHEASTDRTARLLNIRYCLKQYDVCDKELLIAAVRCLSRRLVMDGHDPQKILENDRIDPEKLKNLLGGD